MNTTIGAKINTSMSIQQIEVTGDLGRRFIDYIDASPKTVATYKRNLKQFFKFLYEKGVVRPQRGDILDYKESLLKDKKPTTIQAYITVVKLFFEWLEMEKIYPNIAKHIKGAKVSKNHKKDYLTSKQVKQILNNIDKNTDKGLRDYAILSVMLTGGIRTIEVIRANIEDIRTVGSNTVLYIQGKGKDEKTEYIKLIEPVEIAIREYLKTRTNANDTDPLFTSLSNNSTEKRLTTRSVSRIVKQRFINAGFNSKRLTAHSTRHTAVTLALLGGNTIQEVQQFARHSNINTTLVYAHNLERDKNKCEESIANSIFF